jgi:hypothetical protein
LASTASPSWVILGRVPRVLSAAATAADLPPGVADFSLVLPAPPRVALLTTPPRICPDRTSSSGSPSVVAIDPFGLLLLHAIQGLATGPTITDTPDEQGCSWYPFIDGYFVLDAAAIALALPLPKLEVISEPRFLGIMASPEVQYGTSHIIIFVKTACHLHHVTIL